MEGEKDGRVMASGRGDLAPRSWGIDAPVHIDCRIGSAIFIKIVHSLAKI